MKKAVRRVFVDDSTITSSISLVVEQLEKRLHEKNGDSFISNHEALGIITEEYHELIQAVTSNKNSDVRLELIDIAVGCIFAIASMSAMTNRKK